MQLGCFHLLSRGQRFQRELHAAAVGLDQSPLAQLRSAKIAGDDNGNITQAAATQDGQGRPAGGAD